MIRFALLLLALSSVACTKVDKFDWDIIQLGEPTFMARGFSVYLYGQKTADYTPEGIARSIELFEGYFADRYGAEIPWGKTWATVHFVPYEAWYDDDGVAVRGLTYSDCYLYVAGSVRLWDEPFAHELVHCADNAVTGTSDATHASWGSVYPRLDALNRAIQQELDK